MDNASAGLALKATNLNKVYGPRKALIDISFELPKGAFLSIFGPNGAGKSTLLRTLATLTRPTSGTLTVMGLDAKENPEAVRESIGFIGHESMVYGDLSPEENLVLYGKLYGVSNPQRRAKELLEAVAMKHRSQDPVKTFSRGMMQRVSIARALVNDPALVLLDEPYTGLDPRGTEVFDHMLASIRNDRSFAMVSHDLINGYNLCSHILVLSKGKVMAFGPKESIAKDATAFAQGYAQLVETGLSQ